MTPIRVLIVDDSRSMRQLIASVLGAAPDIDVVGQVADPIEARTAIKALNPDVVTLDVEMPRMNGLDFLEKVMRLRPTPVVMVSNLTQAGGEATIKALEIGAVDCVAKPQLGEAAPFASLAATIRAAASARMSGAARAVQAKGPAARRAGTPAYAPSAQVVVIGSSTGGVEALSTVLASFPANCPATMIVQHMPPLFTRSLAERLNRTCAPAVSEAVDGAPLVPGQVFIAPGGTTHHLEIAGGSQLRCRLKAAPPLNGHCPSVDMLFRSAARAAGREAIGVILTGMGRDGADGLLEMRAAGARTFGQDAVSSLIYGMPKAAFDVGAVETQLGLAKIGPAILAAAAL